MIAAVARAKIMPAQPTALPVSEARLPNGLHVVLAPDPTVSSVVVHVRYHRGSADEGKREAGYTHLVERLLATTSVHLKPGEFDARIDAAGGWANSVTTADHLSVFEQVPAGALELALWLEAERMAGLVEALSDAAIVRERAAITAEYKAAYQDQPYALATATAQQALWPRGEAPPVLGDGAALGLAKLDTVREFVRARIVPSNATLVIAGRFEPAATATMVRRYFGWIPAGKPAPKFHPPEKLQPLGAAVDVDVVAVDAVPKVIVAYRTNKPYASDTLDLEVAAHILGGGRGSRLYARLVEVEGIATDVHVDVVHQAHGGELRIEATAKDANDLAEAQTRIAAAIRDEVATLRAKPLSGDEALSRDQVERARIALDAQLVIALEGLAYRADLLASWSAYAGTPQYLDIQRANLKAVTPESLQRSVSYWLADTASVTVIARPGVRP